MSSSLPQRALSSCINVPVRKGSVRSLCALVPAEFAALGVVLIGAALVYNFTNLFAVNWFLHPDEHSYYVLGRHLFETGSLKMSDPRNQLFPIPVFTPAGAVPVRGEAAPWQGYGMFLLVAASFVLGDRGPFYVVPCLGVVAVAALFLLARELFDQRVALLGTVLFAFTFPMVYWSNMLFPQPAALAFFLGGLYLLARVVQRRRGGVTLYISASLCFACATWLRYDHLLFVLLLTPVFVIHRRSFDCRLAALAIASYVALLVPILLLNVDVYGTPFGVGYTALQGAAPAMQAQQGDLLTTVTSKLEEAYSISFGGGLGRDWTRGWRNAGDWVFGLYPSVVALGGLGLACSLLRGRARGFSLAMLLICFVWGYYILTGGFWGEGRGYYGTNYVRYLLPVWAFLSVHSAVALSCLSARLKAPLSVAALAVFLLTAAWSSVQPIMSPNFGFLNTVAAKERNYDVQNLLTSLPDESVIVSNLYPKYIVGHSVFDVEMIGRYSQEAAGNGGPRATAILYIRQLLKLGLPVYLMEAPWHSTTYLDLETTLANAPGITLDTVSVLPRTAESEAVRLVRVIADCAAWYENIGDLLAGYGCRENSASNEGRTSDDQATQGEIECFLKARPDILEVYRENGWDTSPSGLRAIFDNWWGMTLERSPKLPDAVGEMDLGRRSH